MADKTSANIGFGKQLRDAACVLFGHIIRETKNLFYFLPSTAGAIANRTAVESFSGNKF